MTDEKTTSQEDKNMATEGKQKWSFERILLILALGGNIGVGGFALTGNNNEPPKEEIIEQRDLDLEMCKLRLDICNGNIMFDRSPSKPYDKMDK